MSSRRLLPWLFVLTLLFGQAAAFAHTLTHLQGEDPALPDPVCEMCVAQAHLGSAAPAAVLHLPAEPARLAAATATDAVPPAAGLVRWTHARAPPASI
ncbi:MAG TPA: hypothetical protein PKC12_05490 [Thiobacillaceae bacterium]|nr:hypothetical protein [Thiobacillaceae bacterium]